MVDAPLGKRARTERQLLSQSKAGIVGPPLEAAHTRGQGLGFESPYGIYYAPREVNQLLQNHGIEQYLSELHAAVPPEAGLRVRTETATQWGSRRLGEVTYAVDIVDAGTGRAYNFLEFKIHIGGTRTAPRVSIEPVEFAGNPVAQQAQHIVDVPEKLHIGLRPLRQGKGTTP